MKRLAIIILIILSIVQYSFNYETVTELPDKKISRQIYKTWKIKSFRLERIDELSSFMGDYFIIYANNKQKGFLYSGRVNSCRQGGCSVAGDFETEVYEHFDYFMLCDTNAKVEKVRVFNYRATHGHEVMSTGWLRQFIGYDGKEDLRYGKDIEAISGATISAKAINEDVKLRLNKISNYLN